LESRLQKRQENDGLKNKVKELEYLLENLTEMIVDNCGRCQCTSKLIKKGGEIAFNAHLVDKAPHCAKSTKTDQQYQQLKKLMATLAPE
jgi:uncharacterized cysteine cluster protein YcgN (CxxCxxCC family)